MANKGKKLTDAVPKNSTAVFNYAPIPLGVNWTIDNVICGDVGDGGGKASIYRVRFGSGSPFVALEELAVIPVVGTTVQIQLNEELLGDGVSFLRIERQNTSNTDKELPFMLKAHG